MTHLSSYSSSDPAVAEVVGSEVIGRGVGTAVISAYGGIASVSITVVSSAVSPHLVARVVTALNASSREQIFDSEDDVGYLYVYANYTNGDSHEVDASELSVVVEATDKLSYAVVGNQQKVSIVQDALAGSSCTEPLLRVSLSQCNASMLDAVYPPLNLQLPTPVGLQPLVLSQTDIALPGSFARSGALSIRPSESGSVLNARVLMSAGEPKDMLGDARVRLDSSNPSCVEVASDLSSPLSFDYRALDGGGCTSAVITATFTLGSWIASTNTTVYIVRPRSLTVAPSIYPSCSARATTLYTLGCASPPVRQRVQFAATYVLESDNSTYSVSGTVNLANSDVSITRANLLAVVGVDVHTGTAAGNAAFGIIVRGQSAQSEVTISDTALDLSAIAPSVGETLVTSLAIGVAATFSGRGMSCTYSDGQVRSQLGTTIQDVALFEVDSAYGGILSVANDGTLTALASHWARAPVTVRNRCTPTSTSQVSLYVNTAAAPGQRGRESVVHCQPGIQPYVRRPNCHSTGKRNQE